MQTSHAAVLTVVKNDIPELVTLINNAYRGQGWTNESHLLRGSARINNEVLATELEAPGALMLKSVDEKGVITGCVYLQKKNTSLYLGMLSVLPGIQSKGTGSLLLNASENYAREQGCTKITIQVISVRHELIDWYQRRGFYLTGETAPFPTDDRFGIPVQPLAFAVLEKKTGN